MALPLQLLSKVLVPLILLSSCISMKSENELSKEYYNIGNEFLELKNYEKASSLYEKSLSYDKSNFQAKINLIIALQGKKNYDAAELLIKKEYTTSLNTNNKNLLLLLGKNFFLKKEFEKSNELFFNYINIYPEDKIGYFNIGLNYLNLQDFLKAHDYFLKSYSKDLNFIPSLYNITNYYFENDLYSESIPYITELVLKDSNNDKVHFMYSKILYELNEMQKAKESILKAIELNKESNVYEIFAARVYAKGFDDKKNTLFHIKNALKKGYKTSDLSEIKDFSTLREQFRDEYNEIIKKEIIN